MTKKASTEGISIKATFSALDGIDLSKVRSRADFAAIYDRLFKEALRAVPFMDSKQRLESIECARRCVDSWQKAYAAFVDEDIIIQLQRDIAADKQAVLESFESWIGQTVTADAVERLRERFMSAGADTSPRAARDLQRGP